MNAFHLAIFTLAALTAPSVPATTGRCPGLAVEVQSGAQARWPGLSKQIHQEFAGRTDIDPCARVSVTMRGSSPLVTVTLPDGRLAARSLSRSDEVVPTLAALLLVPEEAASETVVTPPAATAPAAPPPGAASFEAPASVPVAPSAAHADPVGRAPVAVAGPPSLAPVPGPAASAVRLDLSVAMGGRMGDGQMGVGLGISSFVDRAAWLAGFLVRVDSYRGLSAGPATGALEFAVLGGRRLRMGTRALDLLVGPALAVHGVAKSVQQVGSTEPAMTTSPSAEPRLLVSGRLTFRAQSTVRTFVGLDGEAALTDTTNVSVGLAPLPAWTAGLVLGATVGTR